MPLFFLIAIGAGAMTVGATTADVVGDNKEARAAAHAQSVQPQQQTFATMEECQQAMAQRGLAASNCQQRS
jgi:hypothetical protein